jgi:hypothetical protein
MGDDQCLLGRGARATVTGCEHGIGSSFVRSNSLDKDDDVIGSGRRRLLHHRNSWPTNEAATFKPTKTNLAVMKEEATTDGDDQSSNKDSDSVSSDHPDYASCPSPAHQRQIIKNITAGSPTTYAVAKVWYRRWEEHVGLPKGFVAGRTEAPGPVEMDTNNDDCNTYVHEEIWKQLVAWYGVSGSHHLDRKHLYYTDQKVFDMCVLSPFSGIVEHGFKRFSRFEEIGYVELQMRRIFNVPSSRRSRLWISEKAQVPRFHQLLGRSRMLNDCIHRDKTYILALEVADGIRGDSWPTGEPGEPKGELTMRYSELYVGGGSGKGAGGTGGCLADWHTNVRHGLVDLQQAVADYVRQATETFLSDAEIGLQDSLKRLEDQRRAGEAQLKALSAREVELSAAEAVLRDREMAAERARADIDAERNKLDEAEARFHDELTRIETQQRIQDSKVRLDVGGCVHTTSVQTLRRYPDSLLALMFSGRYELMSEPDGSYFIDRDGAHFRYVLNFLRDGRLDPETLPKDRSTIKELICEAKYYQLSELVDYLVKLLKSSSVDGKDASKR